MARYGLTGNIGCGKSTVANFFREFKDVVVFDADSIAKEILCDDRYAPELQRMFGKKIFSKGKIDTKEVSLLVFNNDAALERLENFIHPLTWQAIFQREQKYNDISFFLVESALIYESNKAQIFDGVIVATCPEDVQYDRLIQNRGFTEEGIMKRLKKQLSLAEKVKRADFVIDTDCSLPELKDRVRKLYDRLKGGV